MITRVTTPVRRAGVAVARFSGMRTLFLLAVTVVVGLGVGLLYRGLHSDSPTTPNALAGAQNHTGSIGSAGGAQPAGNGQSNGSGSAGNGGTGRGAAGAGAGAGANGSKGVSSTPAVPTPHDAIAGQPQIRSSNCPDGYNPGDSCTVIYGGVYTLVSHPTATLVIQVTIDGTVAATQTYTAPAGGHQFRGPLQFTVPAHAKKIVYTAALTDVAGGIIVAAMPMSTYGYG